ncbi:substrate-binding protein [Halopseudomonas pelagia]|uniref:substrate-binding protein n=1 Tax=Halopseudomonas pelagia TaxID=553151 RepID=UPI0003B7A066|nr:substrate-binding protein [Halopseudomonas pelagia]
MLSSLLPQGLAAAEPLLLGLNAPRSGEYQQEGLMQTRGAMMAIDEINLAGGVLQRPLALLERDTASKPAKAVTNVDELAAEGARMLFGGASSAVAIAAGKRARDYGLIYFGTLTYSNDTTGKDAHRYMFRESYNAWMASKVLAQHLNEHMPDKNYFYVTADYTWGHTTEQSMRHFTATDNVQDHGRALIPFPGSMQKDLRAAMQAALDSKPDVLVLVLFGDQMVKGMRMAHQMGLTQSTQVVVPNLTLSMVEQAGPALMEGVLGASPWTWNVPYVYDHPRGQAFVERFVELYQTYPSTSAASAYSIVYQWADAVERTRSLDSERLITALEDHQYQLLKDPQTWRAFDHQNVQTVYAVKINPRAQVMKNPLRQDYFELLAAMPGEDAAITREQWGAERRAHNEPEQLR